MIWRLTYCNEDGVEARLDIIKGSSTPVEVIEGTATPFVLNYKMDKPDKSGFFMTSSADISIFETTSFNIDSLKTSSETEIKVEHYIDNILDWAGFVIPDFFSKTIGSPATVEMVASDRLATLKGVTLTDLNQYVSMRDLAVACLAHTGLSLPLYTLADFGNDGQTNAFFKALGLSSRLSDTKGRNISCYDILKSILVASNSKLVQQDGAWHIVNKWQHEQGTGNLFSNLTSSTPYSEQTINFSDVHVGGRRSIVPVAAITGVYHEFGGGRSYPDNFDFRDFGLIPEFNFPGWTKAGTFNVARGDKEIIGYSFDGQMQFGTNTVDSYFFNSNVFNTSNYLQMDGVPVPYTTGQIEVILDLNATAQTVSQFLTNVTAVKIAVGAVKDGSPTIWLNNNGIFAEDNAVIHNLNFDRGATYEAQTKGFNLKGVINNPEGYSIIMRIYGSRDEGEDNRRQIAIHFARIEFKNTQDAPKGIIYKRKQGTDFTKEHDIDTTIFGDYMRKGLDGYFYEYPFDDTSSLYRTAGTLTQPLWTAPNDAEQLPLLHHVTRQKSRMFSLAHNMISARINVSSFKPLNIFIDCDSERYVVVSATYDFLRSEVEVELEQIASTLLDVRDFIYSYFGDGESGISSVGGISGGGGGSTGGGLTPEQIEILSFWKKDPDNPNTIFTEMNAYSKLELSAYGVGDSGGGGGSDYERLDTWADYDSSKEGWVLSAFLGNDLNTRVTAIDGRVTDLENSAGSGSVTSVGISVPTGLSVSNSPITSSGVIAIGLQSGYSIPTTAKQGQWDGVVTDFGNLEIGGRNLILNTSDKWVSKTIVSFGAQLDYIHIQDDWRGKTVTSSFEVKNIPAGESVRIRIDFYRPDNTYITLHYGNIVNLAGKSFVSYTVPTDTQYNRIRARIMPVNYTSDYNVLFRSEKLEFGNKATDWTPAPEDVQAEIDLKANIASPIFTGTVTAPTFIGALTGNASSATKLQTPRTIWGQSFDGTGNVSGVATIGNILVGNSLGNQIDRMNGVLYLQQASSYDLALVNGGGNVGIGTISPSEKLHVVGNILATGEVTAYVASDRRLKENITPITSALDYINRLNPVTYNWNAKAKELNSNKPNGLDYGLIAQEVESVLPNIVHGIFDDKYKSIDYIKLIPIMIGAIKELKQEINKLKK